MELEDKDVTERIIACAFKVHRTLGAGFLEKVYENAMVVELSEAGLEVLQQARLMVTYRERQVGEYFADLLVEGRVVCELKAADRLVEEHEIQLVNYLKATGFDTGLLINFGDKVTMKRKFRRYRVGAAGNVGIEQD
jgi:GxxExxY protein